MDTLEARKTELSTLLADTPEDTSDILPSASAIHAKKVSALTKALNRKEERQEAAETLRGLIERISLTPGPERGEIYATLHGELGTILEWTERQVIGKTEKTKNPAANARGVSVSVVAGARLELLRHPAVIGCSHSRPFEHHIPAFRYVHRRRPSPVRAVARSAHRARQAPLR